LPLLFALPATPAKEDVLKYLGIDPQKPRIAVFDFTGCEGCELQLANKEGTLLDFLALIEVVNFREVSSDKSDTYDIAIIEGSISRDDEVDRLKKIRERAKVLVAMGSCACYGGVNNLKNRFTIDDVVAEVYGKSAVETSAVKRVGDVVQVDLEIPGCPVSKAEVERIIVNIVLGANIKMPKYPVCVECKQKSNPCVVDTGNICLGSITRAGCGAVCTSARVGCLGCRGPAEEANMTSLVSILKEKGFPEDRIQERVAFYNAFNGVGNYES
jgi:coenzyme F420-reducing hydrogenase gamma subunit